MKRSNIIGALILATFFVLTGMYIKQAHAETSVIPLLTARTVTGGCTALNARQFAPIRTFHANGSTSAGAGAAVVEIRGGMTATNITTVLGSFTLTLSADATAAAGNNGFVSQQNWPFMCANVNSISGTDASVNAEVAVD